MCVQSDDELDERVEGEAGHAAAAAATDMHMEARGDGLSHPVPPPHSRGFDDPPDAPPVPLTDAYEAGRGAVPAVDGSAAVHAPAGLKGGLPVQSFLADEAGQDGAGDREGRQEEERREYVHCVVVNTREQHTPVFMQRRELYEQVLRLEACGVQVRKRRTRIRWE